jgi:DNA-binding NarL/FixJ family response regulator
MRRRPFATVLVGTSSLLREGISRILDAANFRIVASASRVEDLVLASLSQHHSILLLINAGDDPDAAVSQIELFKEHHPTGHVAVLADHFQVHDMVCAYRAGTNAYFVKVATSDAFIKTLELVMLGETILPCEFLAFMRNPDDRHGPIAITHNLEGTAGPPVCPEGGNTPRLSAREKCILRRIVEGNSNKVIARRLDIAVATVKVHVKTILRKIRAQNRTQAAIWAMNNASFIWSEGNSLEMHETMSADAVFAAETQMRTALLPARSQIDGADHVTLASIDSPALEAIVRRRS